MLCVQMPLQTCCCFYLYFLYAYYFINVNLRGALSHIHCIYICIYYMYKRMGIP